MLFVANMFTFPTLLPLKSGPDQLEVERLQRLMNPALAAADTWLYLGLLCKCTLAL